MSSQTIVIDTDLVVRLIRAQFPQWKHLPISPVARSGWDNRTFHLGEEMSVRLPSAQEYASQVEKECYWLPILAKSLPLSIPKPLAQGQPMDEYPWKWSIYRWLKGVSANQGEIEDLSQFANDLASFLLALHRIDPVGGPKPGMHSFHRGGSLSVYDSDVQKSLALLKGKIDEKAVLEVWENALTSTWSHAPVWVHGDLSAGNLLTLNGRLSSVIDFGQLVVGDPACDLVIAWTLFKGESRECFRQKLNLDKATWERARGWALWKALLVAASCINPNNAESVKCWQVTEEVTRDHLLNR
jgi:aminoglycoside phosphotransferase (APT) family kinase protein